MQNAPALLIVEQYYVCLVLGSDAVGPPSAERIYDVYLVICSRPSGRGVLRGGERTLIQKLGGMQGDIVSPRCCENNLGGIEGSMG